MGKGQHGGFLVEAGFVTGLVAVVAAVAVPRLLQGAMRANEQFAIDTLRRVAGAQKALRNQGTIDCDRDGRGEFGFFGELTGVCALRIDEAGGVGNTHLQPPVLSRIGPVIASRVKSHGYLFQIYLPDLTRWAVAEGSQGGSSGCSICANHAEQYWCCYAWPTVYGSTGKRAFFINDQGHVLATDNSVMRYHSNVVQPAPNAAFRAGTSGSLECATAAGTIGIDSQHWTEVR